MTRIHAKRRGRPTDGDSAPPGGDRAFDFAAAWLARRGAASEAEVRAFDAWLAESPGHRCAWAKAQDLWALLGAALSDER